MIPYNKIIAVLKNNIFAIILFLFGILIFFFPVIFIQHDLMPGDLGDGRFINYILEHGFLFLKRVEIHKYFWELPMFYPYGNALAYSDVLLGGMITYIPVRIIVNNPQQAFLIWFFINCIFNYFSMYYLLRLLKLKPLSSSVGAFFFAFSLPRYSSIYHLQLFTQYITIFGIICLFKINKDNSKKRNLTLFILCACFFALQLYTSFYLGFFTVYSALIILLIFLFSKKLRTKLFDFIIFYKKELTISIVIFTVLLLPLAYHYLLIGEKFMFTTVWAFNFLYLFNSQSFLDNLFLKTGEISDYEIFIGLGMVTLTFLLFSIFKNLKLYKYFIIFIIATLLSFGFEPFYYTLYSFFPGASAIRAATRCIFMILPVVCYIITYTLDKFKNKVALCFVIILLLIEQIPDSSNFKWSIRKHNQRLRYYSTPKNCSLVTYNINHEPDFEYLLDIIWASTRDNVITTNGYSGFKPFIEKTPAKPECIINAPYINHK